MALLELRQVEARYGPITALRDVSLAVEEGEIVAILGANGAGKTTTLRAISGTVRRSGQVLFASRRIDRCSPEAIARVHVDPLQGYQPYLARRLVYRAGIVDEGERRQVTDIVERLYACFVGCDAMLCEINPLIVTPEGEVRALDAKVTVDDNALFRHPDIAAMRDLDAIPPQERKAKEKGVTYVKLDGEVGILGNGAGLVMSTLDVIALVGGRPANFCDLGGGGDAQGVVDALEVIVADPQVRSILFNIFGGITRCDEVARGILEALGRMSIPYPIVVRLDGTNAEEARRLLTQAGLPNLYVEPTMLDAARKAVELAR
ncbi:MAG: succinate--CoA ligase subunit beta [Thermoleophilia bacterium]